MSSSSSSVILPEKSGYFSVEYKGPMNTICCVYLWGYRSAVDLYIIRHQLENAFIRCIHIGILDQLGVTLEEARNEVHGVIESVLLSAYKPPLIEKKIEWKPTCNVCNSILVKAGKHSYTCDTCDYLDVDKVIKTKKKRKGNTPHRHAFAKNMDCCSCGLSFNEYAKS